MLVKYGIHTMFLRTEILSIMDKISDIHNMVYGTEPVITSTYEGTHKKGSLHYSHLAIDLRKYVGEHESFKYFLLAQIDDKLYDVVEESSHWHIEYDPERTV